MTDKIWGTIRDAVTTVLAWVFTLAYYALVIAALFYVLPPLLQFLYGLVIIFVDWASEIAAIGRNNWR